jgi:DUF2934 family protein
MPEGKIVAKSHRMLQTTEKPDSTGMGDTALNEQIARRAYQYWEARGREDGYDLEDWFRAEQELAPPPVGGYALPK